MEQGRPFDLANLGPQTRQALQMLQDTVDAQVKDWAMFTRQAVEFHLRNARAWANAAVGADLADQVDPGFTLSPAVLNPAHPPLPRDSVNVSLYRKDWVETYIH